MISARLTFFMDHWLLLTVLGGITTSAGAVGGSAKVTKDTTEKFLDGIQKQREAGRKEDKEA